MSSPLRTPASALMLLGGAAVAFVGVGLLMSGHKAVGGLLAALGLAVEVGGAWVHDLGHRRRGEQPHAMWGPGDRNRPARSPRRRS